MQSQFTIQCLPSTTISDQTIKSKKSSYDDDFCISCYVNVMESPGRLFVNPPLIRVTVLDDEALFHHSALVLHLVDELNALDGVPHEQLVADLHAVLLELLSDQLLQQRNNLYSSTHYQYFYKMSSLLCYCIHMSMVLPICQ